MTGFKNQICLPVHLLNNYQLYNIMAYFQLAHFLLYQQPNHFAQKNEFMHLHEKIASIFSTSFVVCNECVRV